MSPTTESTRRPIPQALRLRAGEWPLPLDLHSVFGRSGPLVVEIGFGNGTFFAEMAREHPEWNLLGVEITAASITRGAGIIRREGLEHCRVYCGDGRFFLREMLPNASVHRVYVNFPDPWPKERHQERRLMQVPFLEMLSTRLEPGGELWFTSDHEEYFEFAVSEGERCGLYDVRRASAPEAALRTKYARRWQRERKRIHHAVFAPRRAHADPHAPRLEVIDVAHARLRGELARVARFEKQVFDVETGHVVLLDAARHLLEERLTVRAIVDEAGLRQEVLIAVRETSSGAVYVELDGFGSPASTRGVQIAVEKVADWLAEQGMERLDG